MPVRLKPDVTAGPGATIGLAVAGCRDPKELSMLGLFGPIGMPEMLIILAIVILIFGANRLPELGKGIGQGIKNFKSGMKHESTDEKGN